MTPIEALRAIRTRICAITEKPPSTQCEQDCWAIAHEAILAHEAPITYPDALPYRDIIAHCGECVHYIEGGSVWVAWNYATHMSTELTSPGACRIMMAKHAKDLLPKATLLGAVGAAIMGTFGGA